MKMIMEFDFNKKKDRKIIEDFMEFCDKKVFK